MQKIIYSSPSKIDWDAQSAFKLTNYYTDKEACMVFCYLKQYAENGSLKLCTFCFDKEAHGKNDLQLCLNLNPVLSEDFIQLEFGIDGIGNVIKVKNSDIPVAASDGIKYTSFTSNDQQGYYWCGEISISPEFIEKHFKTKLAEKSVISLNLYKTFDGLTDYAALFPDDENDILNKHKYMQEFIILDY